MAIKKLKEYKTKLSTKEKEESAIAEHFGNSIAKIEVQLQTAASAKQADARLIKDLKSKLDKFKGTTAAGSSSTELSSKKNEEVQLAHKKEVELLKSMHKGEVLELNKRMSDWVENTETQLKVTEKKFKGDIESRNSELTRLKKELDSMAKQVYGDAKTLGDQVKLIKDQKTKLEEKQANVNFLAAEHDSTIASLKTASAELASEHERVLAAHLEEAEKSRHALTDSLSGDHRALLEEKEAKMNALAAEHKKLMATHKQAFEEEKRALESFLKSDHEAAQRLHQKEMDDVVKEHEVTVGELSQKSKKLMAEHDRALDAHREESADEKQALEKSLKADQEAAVKLHEKQVKDMAKEHEVTVGELSQKSKELMEEHKAALDAHREESEEEKNALEASLKADHQAAVNLHEKQIEEMQLQYDLTVGELSEKSKKLMAEHDRALDAHREELAAHREEAEKGRQASADALSGDHKALLEEREAKVKSLAVEHKKLMAAYKQESEKEKDALEESLLADHKAALKLHEKQVEDMVKEHELIVSDLSGKSKKLIENHKKALDTHREESEEEKRALELSLKSDHKAAQRSHQKEIDDMVKQHGLTLTELSESSKILISNHKEELDAHREESADEKKALEASLRADHEAAVLSHQKQINELLRNHGVAIVDLSEQSQKLVDEHEIALAAHRKESEEEKKALEASLRTDHEAAALAHQQKIEEMQLQYDLTASELSGDHKTLLEEREAKVKSLAAEHKKALAAHRQESEKDWEARMKAIAVEHDSTIASLKSKSLKMASEHERVLAAHREEAEKGKQVLAESLSGEHKVLLDEREARVKSLAAEHKKALASHREESEKEKQAKAKSLMAEHAKTLAAHKEESEKEKESRMKALMVEHERVLAAHREEAEKGKQALADSLSGEHKAVLSDKDAAMERTLSAMQKEIDEMSVFESKFVELSKSYEDALEKGRLEVVAEKEHIIAEHSNQATGARKHLLEEESKHKKFRDALLMEEKKLTESQSKIKILEEQLEKAREEFTTAMTKNKKLGVTISELENDFQNLKLEKGQKDTSKDASESPDSGNSKKKVQKAWGLLREVAGVKSEAETELEKDHKSSTAIVEQVDDIPPIAHFDAVNGDDFSFSFDLNPSSSRMVVLVELGSFCLKLSVLMKEELKFEVIETIPCYTASVARGRKAEDLVRGASRFSEPMFENFRKCGKFVGGDAEYVLYDHPDAGLRGGLKVDDSPISPADGLISDQDDSLIHLIKHLFQKSLGKCIDDPSLQIMICFDGLNLESTHANYLAETLIAKLNCDMLCFVQERQLALASVYDQQIARGGTGSSGLIVNVGSRRCDVIPVYEEMVMNTAVQTIPVGGETITDAMQSMMSAQLSDKGEFTALLPRRQQRFARQLKESHAFVALDYDSEVKKNGDFEFSSVKVMGLENESSEVREKRKKKENGKNWGRREASSIDKEVIASLPSGTAISMQLGKELYTCTEVLFRPAILKSLLRSGSDASSTSTKTSTSKGELSDSEVGNSECGLVEAILKAVEAIDSDVRAEICETIILTGGTASLKGLVGRLENSLMAGLEALGVPEFTIENGPEEEGKIENSVTAGAVVSMSHVEFRDGMDFISEDVFNQMEGDVSDLMLQ